MNFQQTNDFFVSNILIYKDLSQVSNKNYGLEETNVLHDFMFQKFVRKKLKNS